MPTALPAFVGGSYTSQSPIADQELLMNWYVELMESPGATSKAALYPTPGVEAFATAVAPGCRGMFTDDTTQRTFAAMGASLVEISSAGVVTVRGTLAVNANPATFSTNGDGGGQLLITSGDKAYSYDLATNTLTEELSSGATMGAVLYGYGLVFDVATGKVQLSDLFDLTTWDPTQYFQRTIGTDPWQAMHVTPYGYICLPGTQTGEFWYNAGTFPIPFAPDPSGNFARGIAAPFSIQQWGSAIVWLSRGIDGDYTVVRATGFSPDRISTHAVEFAIAGYNDDTRINDAIGQVYGEHGHLFYLLTFPSASATWACDALLLGKANAWAQRGTWISEETRFVYWRPVFHTFGFGVHLMGDLESTVIYRMAHSVALDVDSRPIRRVRRSPAILKGHARIIIDRFELLMETGIGVSDDTAQGYNPQVTLRVSRDGGRTWGNERSVSAGKQGEYWRRVIFRMLGMGRDFVLEVSVSDPVPWRISEALLDARVLDQAA